MEASMSLRPILAALLVALAPRLPRWPATAPAM
jgi:hypothetical protein